MGSMRCSPKLTPQARRAAHSADVPARCMPTTNKRCLDLASPIATLRYRKKRLYHNTAFAIAEHDRARIRGLPGPLPTQPVADTGCVSAARGLWLNNAGCGLGTIAPGRHLRIAATLSFTRALPGIRHPHDRFG